MYLFFVRSRYSQQSSARKSGGGNRDARSQTGSRTGSRGTPARNNVGGKICWDGSTMPFFQKTLLMADISGQVAIPPWFDFRTIIGQVWDNLQVLCREEAGGKISRCHRFQLRKVVLPGDGMAAVMSCHYHLGKISIFPGITSRRRRRLRSQSHSFDAKNASSTY